MKSHGHLLNFLSIHGLTYNFWRNTPISNMKHNIYEFRLILKILCFVSKGTLNIPEYRGLLIGRVEYLYRKEHAVENIAYLSW